MCICFILKRKYFGFGKFVFKPHIRTSISITTTWFAFLFQLPTHSHKYFRAENLLSLLQKANICIEIFLNEIFRSTHNNNKHYNITISVIRYPYTRM